MLYDGQPINLNDTLVHITNLIPLIFDLFVIQHPCRFSLFIYPAICGTSYLIFTIIYTYLGGLDKHGFNYVYPILNWKERPMFSTFVGIGAVFFVSFMFINFTVAQILREKFHKKYFVKQDRNKIALITQPV
jgi:hypothetical protein